LFALVTGQPPFSGKSPVGIAAKVLRDPFPDPRKIHPALSTTVCRVIARATARRPEDRYQTPEEMATAVRGSDPR
jgi:serine/threonine-protein kinase